MLTDRFITKQTMDRFYEYLIEEERSSGTIEKYIRDVRLLQSWLGPAPVTKENAARWKQELLQSGRAPSTVNSMLAAANTYFRFMGWDELKLKSIRLQRRFFRENERELTKAEYQLLMETAKKRGDERLALLMETICATGIRVSEVPYITNALQVWQSGNPHFHERQAADDPYSCSALQEAPQIRHQTQDRAGRDFPDEKRDQAGTKADLGTDESLV